MIKDISNFTIFAFQFLRLMKKFFSATLYIAAALCLASCAKVVTPGVNETHKQELVAWMKINHPDISPSGLGIYIVKETPGNGAEVTDNGLALVNYKVTDLEGNITAYTSLETAKQLGTDSKTAYYGPKFWTTYETTIGAGLGNALIGMKVGGSMDVIVPSWLMTARTFDTEQDYLDYYDEEGSSSYSDTRYQFDVLDFTEDIDQWQIDSIGRFFKNPDVMLDGKPASTIFNGMNAAVDTVTVNGFYYKQLAAPANKKDFPKDTVVYINYTGRLLNGLVFDTNIERVARENWLYSKSKTYSPVQINWGEEYSDITMTSSKSSVIPGFALTLWQMKAMEKGVGVFYSKLGYGSSGSGDAIPGYAPLIFEIELVEKPQ